MIKSRAGGPWLARQATTAGPFACVLLLVLLSACGSTSVEETGDYAVERVPVGTSPLHILDLVQADNSLIALASTAGRCGRSFG